MSCDVCLLVSQLLADAFSQQNPFISKTRRRYAPRHEGTPSDPYPAYPLSPCLFFFNASCAPPPPSGIPARILCHGAAAGKDVAGAAICELHRRLQKVETEKRSDVVADASAPVTAEKQQPSGSDVLELSSPRREKGEQQKQLLSSPSRPETTGVAQILYSEAVLGEG